MPVTSVDVDALLPADSPRLSGENQDHVRTLADAGADLPPILVHRGTMRVIDGMHRLRAAAIRGDRRIAVRYFEGTRDAAFLAAVRANVSHGLPLSRTDREAAVLRIAGSSPDLSDRAIAAVCGVSNKTVSAIRRRATGEDPQLRARTGLDGRVRPLDRAEGRRAAQAIIHARPEASLREIAREAGISPNTARDVRAKMDRGEDPVPRQQRRRPRDAEPQREPADIHGALLNMKRDPSIRFSEAGRRLLLWLDVHAANFEDWPDLVRVVPPYQMTSMAVLARQCARVWEAVAESLDHDQQPDVKRPADTA
ncbi:ParB N-terminal domain-containing protein [Amycolatopsis sp. H6(2020)]|nr:ParB N-terminal domain-containing protein [Amycolatopsis sp. H6(2020)]